MIIYGSFKGMGDLLNAAPIIKRELDDGRQVKVLIFPGYSIEKIVELIEWGHNRANLELIDLPVSGKPGDLAGFVMRMATIHPRLVWISPHCPRPVASWKIPLLLWIVRGLFWRRTRIVGAASEPLSFLFDVRLQVDRALPLMQRERQAFSGLESGGSSVDPGPPHFIDKIRRVRERSPCLDLLIHPGANVSNRRWPWKHLSQLVRLLPTDLRIGVMGVPADLEEARRALSGARHIRYISGSLEDAIAAIASTRVLFCMDSGPAHFAASLHVPAVALFGKSDPENIIGLGTSVHPLYERRFPCQPCGKATCSQSEILCMNSIAPEIVANALISLLAPQPV